MQNSRRSPNPILAGAGLGGLLILTVIVVFIYPKVKQQWTAPLGPELGLPTHTLTVPSPKSTEVAAATSTNARPQSETRSPTLTGIPSSPTPTPSATPKPLCGGPAVMTLLAVGADSGADYRYGLADVIRIARVDFLTPKVSVLSMPRDLWVEIPGISDHYDITHGKLNQAYFYGGPGMGYYDGPGDGPGLLARTLDLNFGLRVDHYGAVNMQTFVKIVDAVDGIDIYLPTDVDGRPIDDKTEDMGYFTAGQHHFNGDQALRFSRIRKKYNDFTRMSNQNMVLCALRDKILSASVLPKIPQIITAFQGSVLTDLSPEQLSQLACLAPKVGTENLLFTGLPQDILEPGRVYSPSLNAETFIMKADYAVLRDYLAQFMAGTWPTEPKEPSCP